MYLFQPLWLAVAIVVIIIYIPLCIYFNFFILNTHIIHFIIYIPLCIYFNCLANNSAQRSYRFTFHYVSISTQNNPHYDIKYIFIYIPLCIYFNSCAVQMNALPLCIYIPLCIYFNLRRLLHIHK